MTQAKRIAQSPLKILVAIAAFFAVILFAVAITEIRDSSQGYTREYDAGDYLYPAESGRYGDLYETAVGDMNRRATYSDEVAECRALAFYYEQAILEHAYRESGDVKKADEFAERMREYEEQLGAMASRAEAVREAVSG